MIPMGNGVKHRFLKSRLLFYAMIASVIVISLISFLSALSWIKKPFAGFLIYDCPYVGSMSLAEWPGRQAGLKFLDRVLAMEVNPVWKGQDVVDLVNEQIRGTAVNYTFETKAGRSNLILPVVEFELRDFILVFFFTFLGGLAVLALGGAVFILKPGTRTSWVFFLFCFFLSLYMVTSFEIQTTYHFVRPHYFALPLMAAAVFHLGLIFPDRKRIVSRYPWLEYVAYVPGLAMALGYQVYFFNFETMLKTDSLSWMVDYRTLGTVTRVYSLFCASGLIAMVIHALFAASTAAARQRARMILFGVSIAFLPPALIMMGFFLFKVNFPWNFLVFFVIFFPASIAYSIARHNLFDADTIIKRTVGYAVVTAVVVGVYSGVTVTLNLFVGQYQLAQSRAFPLLFALGVILVFNPLRNRIQGLVDRLFFRKEYDYGKIMDRVSGAMTTLLEMGQILNQLIQTFIKDMFIDTSAILLLDASGTQYKVYIAQGENQSKVEDKAFKRDDPLIQVIEAEKREITRYDVLEDPKYAEISTSCEAGFEAVRASLMVPLIYQDQVIGFVTLGDKKSGKVYNRQDIDLFHTLANQGAVAIENARLFQENLEKQRMEEELNIARDLQTSMLPASCPQVEGFEIAALSMPAREVGGDFYDFIEMSDDRVGLVVGDVTGKSVSGALVMSASRSVFRMLSEEQMSVGDIMTRANQRTKKDIKPGMFVALLYAILDAKHRALSLCSAGQTQPVYLSKETGEAKLVETEGDTFPLGILEDAQYQETKIQLAPGDRVVFYTDGIVEAMNKQEEIFGFDRLLEVVQEASAMNAEALLKEILDRVNVFVGGASQHDDLTVIVVSVE
jgi:sigma-B regulation protein RsbU (phosphoserine phosphatase)